ncbi:Cob(I)yrinic acid a,c-diamide adenosyltransferase [Moraxella atlantae]|uniref:Corrinoid adenosyltransferase n=1 Tax=Faucicola atlantae TaxID=34059 RepID=A0A378QLK6_9GAMM|nr:Cob(I)yrinic acid a,c-diamide adenosyltransferase [Moraxella atlantae]
MGNRLSKIYTRTGDNGTTGLADGSRVAKSDGRFDAMGALDLLNAQLGMVRSLLADKPKFDDSLSMIQHVLFNLGGELAMPEYIGVTADHVTALETQIDTWNADLPPLKDFFCLQVRWRVVKCISRAQRHVMLSVYWCACKRVMAMYLPQAYSLSIACRIICLSWRAWLAV